MAKKILMGVILVLGLIFIYVGLQSPDYFIKRDIEIQGTPEQIFPFVANVKKTAEWMPWQESDPQMKATYQGPEDQVGAISSWESEGSMGVGRAEVVGIEPNRKVVTKITYFKPMEFEQVSEFVLTPKEGGVTVMTWNVSGKNSFLPRLICTLGFMNMDKVVGGEFEKGLKKLKAMVEQTR